MVAASISPDEIASQPDSQFDPWPWAIIVGLICLLPLLLMAVGVDFSTRLSPLTPGALDGLTQAQLGDAIQASVRGNYTHTLLEWTATTSAVFLVALAFMQYRLTRALRR